MWSSDGTVVENDSVSCRIQHTFIEDEYDTLIRYYGNRVTLRDRGGSMKFRLYW